ncbi:axoneme-associated protein mst101(2) [Drosophila virilis]|uniref:axoneme-associated protein mst101(2) n=1 Tax=Drosophila virilis TaxID=7244 RepID=UPI0013964AE8|nr:uncharacterized protein LOC26530800 [Drosophila virilis]
MAENADSLVPDSQVSSCIGSSTAEKKMDTCPENKVIKEHERKHGNQKAKAQEKGEEKATRKKTDKKDTDDKVKLRDVKSVKETPQQQGHEIGGNAKKAKAQSRRWESALKERNAIESKECIKIEGNPTKETFINASGSKRNVKLEVRKRDANSKTGEKLKSQENQRGGLGTQRTTEQRKSDDKLNLECQQSQEQIVSNEKRALDKAPVTKKEVKATSGGATKDNTKKSGIKRQLSLDAQRTQKKTNALDPSQRKTESKEPDCKKLKITDNKSEEQMNPQSQNAKQAPPTKDPVKKISENRVSSSSKQLSNRQTTKSNTKTGKVIDTTTKKTLSDVTKAKAKISINAKEDLMEEEKVNLKKKEAKSRQKEKQKDIKVRVGERSTQILEAQQKLEDQGKLKDMKKLFDDTKVVKPLTNVSKEQETKTMAKREMFNANLTSDETPKCQVKPQEDGANRQKTEKKIDTAKKFKSFDEAIDTSVFTKKSSSRPRKISVDSRNVKINIHVCPYECPILMLFFTLNF